MTPSRLAPSSHRWIVLSVYALAAGLSQMLWLNFAPLISLIQQKYGVSESDAGMLLLVFPLIYVFLSIPSGVVLDRWGYRAGVGAGVVLMAVFSCLRMVEGGYWLMFWAQVGIALGQPLVVNGISKLVLDWFDKKQEAVATGIGTMGMFIGMAAGMALTPPMVSSLGFQGAMAALAAVTVAVAALFFVVVRPNPARTGKAPVTGAEPTPGQSLWSFFRVRNLALIFCLAFIGLGFFNGLTTWIEPLLGANGIGFEQAGMIGGILIVGGIFGAVVIPALSDATMRRKPFLVASIAVALATLYPLLKSGSYGALLALGGAQGFFFLPAFSLLLTMCAEEVGEARAASATGLLMLLGNAGGVIVIVAMEAAGPAQGGPAILLALLAAALLNALVIRETATPAR